MKITKIIVPFAFLILISFTIFTTLTSHKRLNSDLLKNVITENGNKTNISNSVKIENGDNENINNEVLNDPNYVINVNKYYEKEIDKTLESFKKLKIGILNFQGVKTNITSTKWNVEYNVISNKAINRRDLFPHVASYEALFNFKIRNETEKEKYTFQHYREDISLSLRYYELVNEKSLDNYDYIFIPPIGLRIKDNFSKYLQISLNNVKDTKACFYQFVSNEEFPGKPTDKYSSIKASFPLSKPRIYNGILLNPQIMKRMEYYSMILYFIDRIDGNLHVYCDIIDEEIVLIPQIKN